MYNMIKFITKQFKTACPYKIAKKNDILIIHEPLGNINGYYNKVDNQKFIHVNSDLSNWYGTFIVAYQLYYALNNMEYKFSIRENCDHSSEAFKFAVTLLYYDHEKLEHDYSLIMA